MVFKAQSGDTSFDVVGQARETDWCLSHGDLAEYIAPFADIR